MVHQLLKSSKGILSPGSFFEKFAALRNMPMLSSDELLEWGSASSCVNIPSNIAAKTDSRSDLKHKIISHKSVSNYKKKKQGTQH